MELQKPKEAIQIGKEAVLQRSVRGLDLVKRMSQ